MPFCKPPCAHGKEDCQNNRELFRDHGHGERDAGKDAFDQPVGKLVVRDIQPGEAAYQYKQDRRNNRAKLHEPAGLPLKRRRGFRRADDICTDFPELGGFADLIHADQRASLRHKSPRVAVVAPPVPAVCIGGPERDLPNAFRFARHGRLVDAQIVCLKDLPVRRDLVAFGNQHDISRDKIGAVDPPLRSVPQHRTARRRKVL